MRTDFDASRASATLGSHDGKRVIWVAFPKEQSLIDGFRKLVSARWSATKKSWYLSDTPAYRKLFGLPEKENGKEAIMKIHPVNQPAFTRMVEQLKLKGYSPNTLRTYMIEFGQLLYLLKATPVDSLTAERLRSYFLYCINTLGLRENYLHSRINAVKFYFEQVLHREQFFIDIPRPKKPSVLPKAISRQDIAKMIGAIENPKHRLMLKLSYGMGLRVSEVVGLKISHIDSSRMQVLIASAKGKKDRYVPLPISVLEELREYYKSYKPTEYLFEGQYGGQYSIRSVQMVFSKALKRARINKKVGVHGLSQSYATQLMEQGTDTAFIQQLLGHNDKKTTLIYTQVAVKDVAKVKSPLDGL